MKIIVTVVFLVISSTMSNAATYRVPQDYSTISTALLIADYGDTVLISPGTYHEKVMIERPVNLVGEDRQTCILKGEKRESVGNVITVSDSVHITGLTIGDSESGVYVKAGASLTIEDCRIAGCLEDGVGFDDAFNTTLFMRNCLITENGDGIDLESTQGHVLYTRFFNNKDDGMDFDGDCGMLVYGCSFTDNGDDGIEIRIKKRTHALILDCVFEGNGEDGLEIINPPDSEGYGVYNLLSVQKSHFNNNHRYGVGFVTTEVEEYTGEMSPTAVYAVQNTFSGNGKGHVSQNYASVFDAPGNYPQTVTSSMKRTDEINFIEHEVKIPLLVGIYNFKPTTDGTMGDDAEGVNVIGDWIFIADDNSNAVFILDRRSGSVLHKIHTEPFPGSSYKAPGAEGIDIIDYKGNYAVLLADDDTQSLYTLSMEETSLGHVLRRQDTSVVGKIEGIEQIGDYLIAASGFNKLHRVTAEGFQKAGEPVTVTFEGFGKHIAGVGADETGTQIFVTLSAYGEDDSFKRNHKSAFFEMNPKLTDIRQFWHLGPFCNDPRGISAADGLVYVADGRYEFKDEESGEMNRGGEKIFVFLLEDDKEQLENVLPFLPVRYDRNVQ